MTRRLLTPALLAVAAATVEAAPTAEPGWPVPTGFSVSQSGVAAQLDEDPELEIAISSQDGRLYLFEHDGAVLPGWPRYMGGALGPDEWVNQCSSPAVHDLDGDGTREIIVGNFDGRLYVFEPDGTIAAGFPYSAGWMIFSTPAIGDIDGDMEAEIVFGANDGGIHALNGDGSVCNGFPYWTPYVVRSSPALGDLDGDGDLEIVCTADNSTYQLYALQGDGTDMPGFPVYLWQSGAISSPALGDVDFDGDLEIAVGARDGTFHLLHHNGTYLLGWPIDAGYSCESSPTLVDLDDDPQLEIVFGMNDSKVCAYNHDATPLPGWPRPTSYTVKSSASVGDIDADGELEIVIGENTGLVYGWNVDGTDVPGFPLTDPTYTIYSSPLLADLDLDGNLELLIGCNDTWIYCWDLGPGTYDAAALPWPEWRHDERNTGAVPVIDPAAVDLLDPAPLLTLEGNSPNPFVVSTRIAYRLSRPVPAQITVFDPAGRRVRGLIDETGRPGVHSMIWDGRDETGRRLPAGIYLYRLDAGGSTVGGRAVLLR